ncbi:hypothetical protein B0G77_1493 [Paraburkholderia sp. BL10I2N1]|nr:hypothetical protein B0G77_1493 [Paraburkholderia sp. BL10I2N1]
MRGRTPLETGLQMLLRHYFYRQRAPRYQRAGRLSASFPDEIFRRLVSHPAYPAQAARSGQFVVILQWARIVTESQSGTATEVKPCCIHRYRENITRRRSKSDGRARIPAAGFSRAFHTCRIASGPERQNRPAFRLEVQARQASRPSVIRSCGSSMPMNTILLFFFSIGCHFEARSLPIIWCTPWNTTLRSTPFMYSTPL